MSEVDLNEKILNLTVSAVANLLTADYENAISNLKSAEMLDRNNPEILYNLGIAHARLGLNKTSIQYFEKLLNLPSTFVEVLNVKKVLAFLFVKSDELLNAESILDEVLKHVPEDSVALNIKGYILEKSGKYAEAVDIFKQLIEINKSDYNAYNSLGYILSSRFSDFDNSLKYAKIAFQSNSNNPAYLDTLGYIYMKKGDIESGEKYLKKAHSIKPHSAEIIEHIKLLNGFKK